MVLDIGGSVGALHVLVDDGGSAGSCSSPPTTRRSACTPACGCATSPASTSRRRCSPALEEGTYRVLGDDGATVATARVAGGEVAEIDLTALDGAARVDTAR